MTDPRVEEYARLLVERCIDVQPGWQVIVTAQPAARSLVEEVTRWIARREAYALLRIWFEALPWNHEAPERLVGMLPPLDRYVEERADAWITIRAPENTRSDSDLAANRRRLVSKARRPVTRRYLAGEAPWVSCAFPTNAMAQDAGMTISSFEDFLYAACLIDWDAAAATMGPIAALFTQADEVRVVGHGTDLVLGVAGRAADVEDGRINMPGGEIYCCPVEDSVEGVIAFSEFPPVVAGVDVRGARLVFESGKVVDASAEAGEELLLDTLATDEGARRVGELGIGCNPGITRYMKNAMFDEKIEGTAHIGLGAGFPSIGGTNTSAIHMDLVKDLRNGGRIYCDGRIVQENGVWVH